LPPGRDFRHENETFWNSRCLAEWAALIKVEAREIILETSALDWIAHKTKSRVGEGEDVEA
jgi:hypothetical protein